MTRIEISPTRTPGRWMVRAVVDGKIVDVLANVPIWRATAKAQSLAFGRDVPILKTG